MSKKSTLFVEKSLIDKNVFEELKKQARTGTNTNPSPGAFLYGKGGNKTDPNQ